MEGRERLHVVAISQTSSLMDLSDPQRHHDPGVTLASGRLLCLRNAFIGLLCGTLLQ